MSEVPLQCLNPPNIRLPPASEGGSGATGYSNKVRGRVCVCVRERERESQSVCVCVGERDSEGERAKA